MPKLLLPLIAALAVVALAITLEACTGETDEPDGPAPTPEPTSSPAVTSEITATSTPESYWTSTGSSFSGYSTWWSIPSGYCLSSVAARFVAGDFDGDGDDDLATFYDYGTPAGKSRIHVWISNGDNSFAWSGPPGQPGAPALGWWRIASGYELSRIGTTNPGDDRIAAGDFDDE
jgi:hypothetical protein